MIVAFQPRARGAMWRRFRASSGQRDETDVGRGEVWRHVRRRRRSRTSVTRPRVDRPHTRSACRAARTPPMGFRRAQVDSSVPGPLGGAIAAHAWMAVFGRPPNRTAATASGGTRCQPQYRRPCRPWCSDTRIIHARRGSLRCSAPGASAQVCRKPRASDRYGPPSKPPMVQAHRRIARRRVLDSACDASSAAAA